MISVFYGPKGMGKSRRLIETASRAYRDGEEDAVFIDNDTDRMFMLDRGIRFINASEYSIDGPKMFSGFLCGLAAQDYDLQAIYINSFVKIVKHPVSSLEEMFGFLEEFSEKHSIKLYLCVSGTTEPPEFLKPYIV